MATLAFLVENTIIDGNIITNGVVTQGSVDNSYGYTNLIYCSASATIINNILGGITGGLFHNWMMFLNNCSCKVINNTFIRSNNQIAAYISATGANDQQIIHNTFDQTTIDGNYLGAGVNTTLVSGITATSIYHSNLNQTAYIAISLLDYAKYMGSSNNFTGTVNGPYTPGTGIGGGITGTGLTTNGPANIPPNIIYDNTSFVSVSGTIPSTFTVGRFSTLGSFPNGSDVVITDSINSNPVGFPVNTSIRNFSTTIPLDYILPSNVKIIQAQIGAFVQLTGSSTLSADSSIVGALANYNQLSLSLNSINNFLTQASVNGVLDVQRTVGFTNTMTKDTLVVFNPIITSGSGVNGTYHGASTAQITTGTQYCTVTDNGTNYITNANNKIELCVDLNFVGNVSGSAGSIQWILSPVVITYRW